MMNSRGGTQAGLCDVLQILPTMPMQPILIKISYFRPQTFFACWCSRLKSIPRTPPPKKNSSPCKPQTVPLFGNMTLQMSLVEDLEMQPRFEVGPKSNNGCPHKKTERNRDTQRRWCEGDRDRDWRDAATSPGKPGPWKGDSPQRLWRTWPAGTLSWLVASSARQKYNSVVLSHQVWGHWLQQP